MQTLSNLMMDASLLDLIAPAFFILCWMIYAVIADNPSLDKNSLMRRMHDYRLSWMEQMMRREMRMVDIQVVQILVHNVSFFASSAILIVGGCVAVLGSGDRARLVIEELPFAARSDAQLWEFKLLLLIIVFVYAFFKFTWSIRQFNYVAILIGAAPPADEPFRKDYAEKLALVASRSANHFNRAMRGFYFGLAALSWAIQPWLFMALTVLVVLVIYRREHRSQFLDILGPVGASIHD